MDVTLVINYLCSCGNKQLYVDDLDLTDNPGILVIRFHCPECGKRYTSSIYATTVSTAN